MNIAFDCPECGSKLRGVLTLDFVNAGYKFEIERGERITMGFEDGDYFYEYSDTILTAPPSKTPHDMIMATMRMPGISFFKTKHNKDMRKAIPELAWEDLKDFLMAYKNFNKPIITRLFHKLLNNKDKLKYDVDYHMAFFKCLHFFIFPWVDFDNHRDYVQFLSSNFFSYRNYKNPKLNDFMNSFSGKISNDMTEDLVNLVTRFIDFRENLIYANQEVHTLTHASIENFTALKNFYTDCFEFLGKYSHLIFRLQNLIERGDQESLPTGLPKNILSIEDFNSSDNGSKASYLKLSKTPELIEIFDNAFNSRLRNGINHFKAKMESSTQIISYYPVTKRPEEEHQISYSEFLKLNLDIFQSVLKIGQLLKFKAVYNQAVKPST